MTEENKRIFKQFVKGVFAMMSVLFLIITSSGVWNGVSLGTIEPFYGWVAGANLVVTGCAFYRFFKPWLSQK